MNKINYKVYLTSMIETLINHNDKTDLGDYVLEYYKDYSSVGGGDMVYGDATLAIAVRLREKASNKIVWGNIYHKRLIENASPHMREIREQLDKMQAELESKSLEEKMSFILRLEKGIVRRPYAKTPFIDPVIADFFGNLQGYHDDYPTVSLNGKFPKDAIEQLDYAFNETKENVQIKNTINK